ncbi:uncharacterized protein LOC141803824 [Halichoeres trimaculatus]|uniref:uncharacterized protein LOC141803824 n=1 Tax=Halichoeres trimaculatus TaxID=147232 RepID=UPI003D9EC1C4
MSRSPDRMKRKGKRAFAYFAAVVIVSCYLAPTIDCLRLKKTERREGRKELDAAQTTAFHEGRILFGRTFEKGPGLESQDIDGTKKSNDSSEDDSSYQADAVWSMVPVQDISSREASWKRMTPSLQCGGDRLKFRAVGPGVTHFKIEQGDAPPMPLSQVPPSCGYSMQRNPFALVMQVPYDGCNMVQDGGNYMLPMRWQGVPVSLVCPKPQLPSAPQMLVYPQLYPQMPVQQHYSKIPDMSHQSAYYPQYPQQQQYPSYQQQQQQYPSYPQHHQQQQYPSYPQHQQQQQYPSYPQQQQQYPSYPKQHQQYPSYPQQQQQFPHFPEPSKAQTPGHPVYPFYPYYYPSFQWPQKGQQTTTTPTTTHPTTTHSTTTTPTTTTTTTAATSTTTTPPPTTTTQTTTKSTTVPQLPYYPYFPPYPPYPMFPPFVPPYPQPPTTKPTTTTTTTKAPVTASLPPPPPPPPVFPPHFHPHVHNLPFPIPPNYPPPPPPPPYLPMFRP